MRKKRKLFIVNIAILQIILLISLSFSFAFILSNYVGVASAQAVPRGFGSGVPRPSTAPTPAISRSAVTERFVYNENLGSSTQARNIIVRQSGSEVELFDETLNRNLGPGEVADVTKKAGYDSSLVSQNSFDATFANSDKALGQWGFNEQVGDWTNVKTTLSTDGKTATTVWKDNFGNEKTITGAADKSTSTAVTAASRAGTAPGASFNPLGLLKNPITGGFAHLLNGLMWGGMVYGVFKLLGSFGILDKELADALAVSSFAGIMGWQGAHAVSAWFSSTGQSTLATGVAPLIGIGIGVAVFLMTYKKTKQKLIKFECFPWEPPLGGSDCEKCNDDPSMPCSEYRCKSLGQACELLNKGTDEELCDWVGKDDVVRPKIRPWEDALKPSSLRYNTLNPNPTEHGYLVVLLDESTSDKCLKPYSKIGFGIETDEPSQCKIDLEYKETMDEMTDFFAESSTFKLQHAYTDFRVPNTTTNIDGEELSLYVRCMDANGNGKDGDILQIKFCVQEGPDLTAPVVEGFSINTGSPVQHGIDHIPNFEVYVSEPAQCKWDRTDKEFNVMTNTMTCANEYYQVNAQSNYVCTTTLTGIIDRQDNNFFFRCNDFSTADGGPNKMSVGEPLTLRGTEPLILEDEDVGPKGIVPGSTEKVTLNLTAITSSGSDEGRAVCSFSTTSPENDPGYSSYIRMENTNDFKHSHSIDLGAGTYTYHFVCIDDGSNSATAQTTFTVVVDTQAPKITRAYIEENDLVIITDEDASCYYSTSNCDYNLEDALGSQLIYKEGDRRDIHILQGWDSQFAHYIKCADDNGKQPAPNACQIIVKGSDF